MCQVCPNTRWLACREWPQEEGQERGPTQHNHPQGFYIGGERCYHFSPRHQGPENALLYRKECMSFLTRRKDFQKEMQDTKTWLSQYDLWPHSPYVTTCHTLPVAWESYLWRPGSGSQAGRPRPHLSHQLNVFSSCPAKRGQKGGWGSYASAIGQCSRGGAPGPCVNTPEEAAGPGLQPSHLGPGATWVLPRFQGPEGNEPSLARSVTETRVFP